MRHGAIVENTVFNLYTQFNADRLLVLTTKTTRRTTLVAVGDQRDPFSGLKNTTLPKILLPDEFFQAENAPKPFSLSVPRRMRPIT